ncbi:hypothetical protein NFI96_008201 [Prochilodus magdalenae]|nr:hypothetical protein NFI96_008201 [Prochilodus magdalenae]
MNMLEQAKCVALTGDHWTSVSNDNYLGVTVHFTDKEWNLQSFALTVSKTETRNYAEACGDHFLDVTKEWNITEKLTTLGTDSARNMVAAARLLPFEHVPCMAHSLQRTVTVSLRDSGFESLLAKCRKIVRHFKHSPSNAHELSEQQVALGQKHESLVQDVAIRWNSTLEMVKRILRNKSPLITTLALQNSNVAMLSAQELAKLQKLEELLEPCRYVTEILRGEQYVSCSVVLPALCHLFRVMEPSDDDPVYVVRFKTVFIPDLTKRKDTTNLTWLKITTALDPRFKDLKCLPKDERSEIWASLHNLMMAEMPAQQPSAEATETQPSKKRRMSAFLLGSSDTDTDEEEESIEQCLDRYKAECKMDMEGCPLQWWSTREGAHARLAPIARKYLSTPATTVPWLCTLGVCFPRQYHYVNEYKTWPEAQSYCREHYTDLASIDTAEEGLGLLNLVDVRSSSPTWIGLYDDMSSWRWSLEDDGFYKGDERNFRNWYIQKPVNWNGNSLCAFITVLDMTWQAASCSYAFPFICYNGPSSTSVHQYHFINESKTWTEAQRYCRGLYNDLATIDNMEEMDMIINTVNGSYSGLAWIGLYDDLDSWRWSLNNGSFYMEGERDYRAWKQEPNNGGGKELCVYMSSSGTWFDVSCDARLTFVCYDEVCTGSSCVPHQYHFINESVTWAVAQRYCRQNYTDLATFANVQEVNRVLMTVKGTYSGLAWIGLYDDLNSWRWSLEEDSFYKENERNFRNWYREKPTNAAFWCTIPATPLQRCSRGVCVVGAYMAATSDAACWLDQPGAFWGLEFWAVVPPERRRRGRPLLAAGDWPSRQYHFVNESKTWTEAQSYCKELYTDLATIDNMEEMNMLNNTVNGSYSGLAWIGLYDDLESWRWSLDNDSFYMEGERDYRGWYQEPDNNGGNELCVRMSRTGEWYDDECTTNYASICSNGPMAGLRMKVRAPGNLAQFQIKEVLLEQVFFQFLSSHAGDFSPHYASGSGTAVAVRIFFLPRPGLCTLGVCLPRQYHYVNEGKTWSEAQSYCREHYTDLASIDNAEEGLGLLNLVDVRSSGPTWIGLYDDLNSWRWSLEDDGFYKGDEKNFRNWHIYKPTNQDGNSLCTAVSAYYSPYMWSEAPCSLAMPFICYDGSVNASQRYVVVSENKNWTEAQRYCREHHTDLVSVRNETENQSYWMPGQPYNYGQNGHCTAVSFSDFGQWTDQNCNEAFPFLCYSGISSASARQYHFVNESKTWTEAQRYCRENHTDLATIDNMEEMDMIINTVNGSYSGLAWIGLYDDLDSWRWSLDDDSFYMEGERDYRGWKHEPDNNGGKELCVLMSSGTWFDIPCDTHNTFVCYDGRAGSENYIWINQGMSWPDAQHYCREHHTDLASVRNWTENQRILNITQKNTSDVWIGLYRTRLWSDQHTSTYENWRPEYTRKIVSVVEEAIDGKVYRWPYVPETYGYQHCTAVSFGDSGQWTDQNCLDELPFVCYNRFCTGSLCVPHQYHFINKPMTWAAAQSYCRETYTDLATFDNVQEVNRLLMTVKGTYSGLAWIGLYDDLNSWRWSLEEDSFYKENERNFRNWYIKKPKNVGGRSLCVIFWRLQGMWDEWPCDSVSGFVCYDGSVNARQRYVVPSEYMTWTQAQRYCREHYTDLASVRSESENQKIKSILRYNNGYYKYLWIGLYRTRSWSDKSNSSFSNWRPGQPDNAGQNEHCTAVSFIDFNQWTDENCDQAFPFLCYSAPLDLPSRQYHFVNESKTWTEAQTYCRELYTDLATIDNMEDMDMINNTVNGSYSGLAWIGLYDDLEGWRWSLDDDSFYMEGERDYRGWYQEPNNLDGNEFCVHMSGTEGWFDVPCYFEFGFVCYNGENNTYVYISEGASWGDARSLCRTQYTDLASVRNETELQQILRVSNERKVWIGLYRDRPMWSDQSNSTFTYWKQDTISETSGYERDRHCTAVDLKHSAQWIHKNCLASLPFFCYNASALQVPDLVVGLQMKVRTAGNLVPLQIEEFLLQQLKQKFGALGLPSNFTVKVKSIRKAIP